MNQHSFSTAVLSGPVLLWQGEQEKHAKNVYLQLKNTFLEFYDDEIKTARGNACRRSLSARDQLHRSVSDGSEGSITEHKEAIGPSWELSRANTQSTTATAISLQNSGYTSDTSGRSGSSGDVLGVISPTSIAPSRKTVSQHPVQQQKQPSQEQQMQQGGPMTAKDGQPITTLMIRGIPCSHSSEAVRGILDRLSFAGTYDFFYLPKAGNTQSNLGYAFVNFPSPAVAQRCVDTLSSVPLDPRRSTKLCSTAPADIQGLEQLRKFFRRTSVSRGNRGPVFLKVHDTAPTE
jgi:hypothetical protein